MIGTTGARFPGVRRIAVLRGGGLGDLLFALPAMEALRAAYPRAEIVLLGSPLHAELLARRPAPVSRVEVLPVAPGIRAAPGRHPDPGEMADFRRRVRAAGPIDLAVQLHGGGRHANPFLRALQPRHTVGTATDDAEPLERTLPYVHFQHEVIRWLEVVALAGAPALGWEPSVSLTAAEISSVGSLLPADLTPVVAVHPGANDPRRRWPPAGFARVIAELVDDGAVVRIVGAADDRPLAEEVRYLAEDLNPTRPGAVQVVAGELGLGRTAALLAAADVVVANDSGPRHLAQAVGSATVGIFWLGNVITAAPLGRLRHRVHLSFVTRCPTCGVDVTQVGWTAPRCEHDESLVADVAVEPVLADSRQLLKQARHRSATAARAAVADQLVARSDV